MQELVEFARENWPLVLTFFLIAGWWLGMELWYWSSGVKVADCEEATRLYNREGAQFVDVRPSKEFREGHLPEAFNLPEREFDQVVGKLQKEADPGTPLVVYDADGVQTNRTARKLKKLGYERVYRIKGGLKAWRGAGYPMEGDQQLAAQKSQGKGQGKGQKKGKG